jgi:hypothetical protein
MKLLAEGRSIAAPLQRRGRGTVTMALANVVFILELVG